MLMAAVLFVCTVTFLNSYLVSDDMQKFSVYPNLSDITGSIALTIFIPIVVALIPAIGALRPSLRELLDFNRDKN
jgi:Mn2+/Fe2+ NRAMP family transporter